MTYTDGVLRDERLRDFRVFLWLVWKSLGLPEPTPVQYDIAFWLQHGPDRIVLEAFRGVGKSWIAAAFVVWQLYWDPDENFLVVSQAKGHADDMSTFILQIIHTVPGMEFLTPENRDRKSKVAFDVGPARPSKQPSVKSVGITGQMTGSRAGVVIADDVEAMNNSETQLKRERLAFLVQEFAAIAKPAKVTARGARQGRIIYLGTPQTEQSIYNLLPDRGYITRIYPSEYPEEQLLRTYGERLAPMIRDRLAADPSLAGQPTDPARFGPLVLDAKRQEYGRSGYSLQFMLDTSLSDANRYPLKLSDLLIFACDPLIAPQKLVWSPYDAQILRDLPAPGFNGDRFMAPVVPDKTTWDPYAGCVMYIDPAGTGQDETAYAIVKQLHGLLYVVEATGLQGGYNDSTMVTLATRAKVNGVKHIQIEANFGDGMFTKLLQPHLGRIYPCTTEDVKVQMQKERRIIDTLEPVMNQHRLVVDPRVVKNDPHRRESLPVEHAARYELFYQMTRITRERGALAHDDRLDALAGAVAYWVDALARDVDKSGANSRQQAFDESLKTFFKNTYQPDRPNRAGEKSWMGRNNGVGQR